MVENFDEWFHDILEQADITDSRYPIKGMAVWMPYGFQIRKHSMNIIKKLLDKDHEEVLFPMLVPETELAKEGIHVKGFEDEVYWVTKGGQTELNEKLALRPTSETAIYPMYSLWIRTHIDLPIKFYQIVNTFRYETKHTRPLIRVREITTFKEAHTAHATKEESDEQIQEFIAIYKEQTEKPCRLVQSTIWVRLLPKHSTLPLKIRTVSTNWFTRPVQEYPTGLLRQLLEFMETTRVYACHQKYHQTR